MHGQWQGMADEGVQAEPPQTHSLRQAPATHPAEEPEELLEAGSQAPLPGAAGPVAQIQAAGPTSSLPAAAPSVQTAGHLITPRIGPQTSEIAQGTSLGSQAAADAAAQSHPASSRAASAQTSKMHVASDGVQAGQQPQSMSPAPQNATPTRSAGVQVAHVSFHAALCFGMSRQEQRALQPPYNLVLTAVQC